MTKFILHGRMTSVRNENNKNFFKEITKDLPSKPKILISLFAIDEDRWKEEFAYQKNNFVENLGNQNIEFRLASKKDFLKQIKWADAVHFRGGNTLKLLDLIKKYPDFRKKLKNKIVSGSSAGALFLVNEFYDQDHTKIFQDLGILPINLITHYKSEKYLPIEKRFIKNLQKNPEHKLILIEETEFKVFQDKL